MAKIDKQKENQFERPFGVPNPLFTNDKEKDFVKQINQEIIDNVVDQRILYYPVDYTKTNYHSLYGEAIKKVFMSPIFIKALVNWKGFTTKLDDFGLDKKSSIEVYLFSRRISEDLDLKVKEGDYIQYGEFLYEIITINEPKELYGDIRQRYELIITCDLARKGNVDINTLKDLKPIN